MVDDNTNNGEDNGTRRRTRLFAGRRRRADDQRPVPETSAPVNDVTTPPGPDFSAAEEQPVQDGSTAAHSFSGIGHHEPGLEPEVLPADPRPDVVVRPPTSILFQAPDLPPMVFQPERAEQDDDFPRENDGVSVRRRARRRSGEENVGTDDLPPGTVVKVRPPRERHVEQITEPQRVKGSTRLEAKKQRRRDGREAGRRRQVITEAEFLARREAVDRVMVVRSKAERTQIAVLEDGVLVEHYVARSQEASLIGNVYLGRVQNVLPSMEAAFVDIGRGRNAVLYSGEVDWDAAQGDKPSGSARRIELALKPGDTVLVQVTKDPVGHKGARLTSQVSLPGRYLVYVPNGSMNGISRKLPDTERARLKKILKEVLPDNVGVIVRTAAEGATEEQLTLDVNRLTSQWERITEQVAKQQAPALLHSEPDLLIKIVRDVFNEDFHRIVIAGDDARSTIESYLTQVAPDLVERVEVYQGERDAFDEYRVTEQIEKALDRKVFLPSGGSLVIDRTEAMTVIDVNTGKFVGSGGNLEETVTKNNLEAADEIVRQLRLRDIGGIIVVDFIDMVLETNRDLVLRRLVECLSRDRTKHQVAEVTSLGLVQMTRKKLGLGLLESFSEPCEVCAGRGVIVHHEPVSKHGGATSSSSSSSERRRSKSKGTTPNGSGVTTNGNGNGNGGSGGGSLGTHSITDEAKNALAKIAAGTLKTPPREPGEHAGDSVSSVQSSALAGSDSAAEDSPVQDAASATDQQPVSTRPTRRERQRANAAAAQAAAAASEAADIENVTGSAEGSAPVPPEYPAAIEAEHAVTTEPASEPAAEGEPLVETIDILDIPIEPRRTARRVKREDAESLLDTVLGSLPEPKPAGEGRAKRRRVTTAALTAPVDPAE